MCFDDASGYARAQRHTMKTIGKVVVVDVFGNTGELLRTLFTVGALANTRHACLSYKTFRHEGTANTPEGLA